MNDIRRTILWVVFGMSMVLLWDKWQIHNGAKPTFFPEPASVTAQAVPAAAPAGVTSPATSGVPVNTAALPAASTAAPSNNAVAQPTKEIITVTTDVYKLGFDAVGGSLIRAEFLKQNDIVNKNVNMVLLDQSKDRLYNAQTGLSGSPAWPNHMTPMTLVTPERQLKDGSDHLTLRFEAASGNVKLVKTYVLRRGAYDIGVTHEVTNLGDAAIAPELYLQLIRDGNKPAGESSFYSTFTGPVVYSDTKKYQKN